ncbi:uncharacterized protein RAG0_01411 [Rhynchosporium agropyri]|uniref:Uncharacterized protein n=2 Tax=Rhynchosporium TaxID=38037 RepID=A0A1E1K180_9HELO|nr:uncharacterized protein RAG0_01411 [Rhynchosporium agropyri]CZT09300.1 uncharacterized protein RCO7_15020 [Rhynchosporium commune]
MSQILLPFHAFLAETGHGSGGWHEVELIVDSQNMICQSASLGSNQGTKSSVGMMSAGRWA